MCGIAGIISFQKPVGLPEIRSMTDAIAHRGPDGEGQWISPDGRAGLGHRRLSIIDLSTAAAQPMHAANARFVLTFNGEIYNYIELREQLTARGWRFSTASDSEVLLAMYEYYGEACLQHLDGMFAFAIWDEKEKKLFCARDRFGEKPFFYFRDKHRFCFGSEMKALWAAGCPRSVSNKRLHYYLSFNLYQDPNDASSTFYEDILQLPPAHCMTVKAEGQVSVRRYWSFDTRTELKIGFDEACAQFDRLLRESITRRLRSDVPVGSSLSGGLDSSAIVLLINRMKTAGQEQKTFSARFEGFAKDEGEYIHEVLRIAQSAKGFETWPKADLLSDIDTIWYHQEEPFGSASIVAQWAVMKLAKEHNVTVLLDGQGADEILGGYRQFFTPFLHHLLATRDPSFAHEKQKLLEIQNFRYLPNRATRYMLLYPRMFRTASSARSVFRVRKKKKIDQAFYHDSFFPGVSEMRSPFEGEMNDDVKLLQQRIMERAGFTPLLRYADRNSMAHARELRLPFLSHKLVEFCISLPDSYKIHDGWTKYLQRMTYKELLPEKICWRKDKVGFEAPQSDWLANSTGREMVAAAEETLLKHQVVRSNAGIDDWRKLMAARLLVTA